MALRKAWDDRAVRRFAAGEHVGDGWPRGMPAVEQVLAEGFEVTPGVTLLYGENGAGKSTLVEAFAMRFGLGAEGGSTAGHTTHQTESPLFSWLRMERGEGDQT